MPGIGQEASGVCQHADEAGQVAHIGQGCHLLLNASLVIVEPPGAALLDLCHSAGILEAARDGADGLVVIGVQAVEDCPGELIRLAEGKVYACKKGDEQQIHGEYFIEKQYEEDGEIYYRILTNEASEVLMPATPALEDGYMCVIKEI